MVAFNQISSDILEPFFAVEFDSSKAQQGPSLLSYKALLVGQKLAAGSAAADAPVRCTSVEQAIALAGRGSMLHRMAIGWFAINKSTELWLGVLTDDAGGTAATGTIVVAGPSTAAGVIALYLGGVLVPVSINSGVASTAIATAIAAAINANLDLPVTATVNASTVTILFRHKGTVGNSYDVRYNFLSTDALPAGVGLTITAVGGVVAGATDPVLTNLVAAIASLWFQVWGHPYTATTPLAAIEAELEARFGPMRQQQGLAFTSAQGVFSTLATLGTGRNSKHSNITAQTGKVPLTPPMEFAAETAAIAALYGSADPARPFQTLAYVNAIAAAETDQWTFDERNLLLHDGISTTKRVTGGGVQIGRLITTYQTSPSGAVDPSYRDVNTLLTLLYLRYDFRTRMQLKYPRHKLANDGVFLGSGQAVITPAIGKAEAVTWFEDMQDLGLVEPGQAALDQFKRDLICVRSNTDANRLEWLLPPDLMNAFVVGAAQIQFRL